MSSGTPKFLKRMQQQKSPDASNFKHNRGASMTQSKSPGGIHFLSRQYQNVVQQAGTPTQAPPPQTPPPQAPPPQAPPPQAPPLQVPPPPQASTSPTPRPVPALIPMPSSTLKKDPHFIQQHRRALDKRRQDNVHRDQQGIYLPNDVNRNHEQWCNDYDRLLLETDKVLAMYTQMQAMYTQMQKVQEVNDAQTKDTAANTSNDKVVVQQLRQNVQQLRQKDTAQTSEIAALKGTVAQLEATVTSTKTLLTDEQERCEVMRIERNQARKTELMALDNAVTKAECEKLANRVAVLESDNAVLLAEKTQWLNNLERENTHLTELFDEARSAKDVMVRELNAIDEERLQLANEREELQQLLNENEVINSTKTKVPGASAHAGFFRVTHTTFDTMSEARLKFYKLQEKLKRRQDKITTVFDAGSTLIHYYSNSNEGPAAANAVIQLTGSLLERALHCDMSLVEDALSKSLDISNGSSYVDNNEDVRNIWEELDTRLEEQTSVMERGCKDMVTMFIDAFNVLQHSKVKGTPPPQDSMRKMEDINVIYGELMTNALAVGGSPSHVGEDVEYEDKVFDRVIASVRGHDGNGGGVADSGMESLLETTAQELEQKNKSYTLLAQKHELLQHNYKALTQRARANGI